MPSKNDLPGTTMQQVPSYEVSEFGARKHPYCICVFVLNEGERVQAQLRQMASYASSVDIIVADGGSTDGSLSPAFLKQQNVRTLLTKIGPGKLSAQMRMAFEYAIDQAYEGVMTIDGNNKDDPAAIPLFSQALKQGYDHVQGSRFIPGGRAVNTPFFRLFAVRLLHAPLIRWSSGFHYTDTTNGFRAYSRVLLLDGRVKPFREVFCRYELHYYLAIRAARLGFRLIEVPVTRSYPTVGKTPTKISPLRGNLLIFYTLIRACLGGYNPRRERG